MPANNKPARPDSKAPVPLDLDVLSEQSSIQFLMERTADRRRGCEDDADTVRTIAQKLDGLALALEQCAAYIRHRRSSFADYLRDWESQCSAVLAWHDPVKSHCPRSLAMTCETSISQLGEDARRLWDILSWLAPGPLPCLPLQNLYALTDARLALEELTGFHLASYKAFARNHFRYNALETTLPGSSMKAQRALQRWVSSSSPVRAMKSANQSHLSRSQNRSAAEIDCRQAARRASAASQPFDGIEVGAVGGGRNCSSK